MATLKNVAKLKIYPYYHSVEKAEMTDYMAVSLQCSGGICFLLNNNVLRVQHDTNILNDVKTSTGRRHRLFPLFRSG